MKQQPIQYLAFDVHQATIVASVRDERGVVVMRATLRTEARAVLAFARRLGSRVHIAFEEGCQAQWLHDLLVPYAERVIVCNVRGKSAGGNKSDRIDADDLSERLRLGALKGVYHGASSVLALKELVRSYSNLVEDASLEWAFYESDCQGRFSSLLIAFSSSPLQSAPSDTRTTNVGASGWAEQSSSADSSSVSLLRSI